MTNEEFKSQIVTFSKRIPTLLAGSAGAKIGAELGPLAQKLTNAPDLATAFNILKDDPAKLSAFEDMVAARVASAGADSANPSFEYTWVAPGISGIILIGFFILLGILLWRKDWSNLGDIKNVLFTLLGALGAAFTQVVNYWLGSSKGSADKTNLLASSQSPGA